MQHVIFDEFAQGVSGGAGISAQGVSGGAEIAPEPSGPTPIGLTGIMMMASASLMDSASKKIDALTAERDALTAERDALREKVESAIRICTVGSRSVAAILDVLKE